MKFYLFFLLFLFACKTPSEPLGVTISYEYHIDTIDYCISIDLDENVLVAALGSNGYARYDIVNSNTDVLS